MLLTDIGDNEAFTGLTEHAQACDSGARVPGQRAELGPVSDPRETRRLLGVPLFSVPALSRAPARTPPHPRRGLPSPLESVGP